MERSFLFGISILFLSFVGTCVSLRTSGDSQQRHCQSTAEFHQQLINTQQTILKQLDERKFYEYVTVELYDNGAIKSITKGTDWTVVLAIGIPVALVGGTAVYFIGPTNVVNAMKHIMPYVNVKMLAGA
jgi:hypothetical protein